MFLETCCYSIFNIHVFGASDVNFNQLFQMTAGTFLFSCPAEAGQQT